MPKLDISQYFDVESSIINTDDFICLENADYILSQLIIKNINSINYPIDVDIECTSNETKAELASVYFLYLKSTEKPLKTFDSFVMDTLDTDRETYPSLDALYDAVNSEQNDRVDDLLYEIFNQDRFDDFLQSLESEGIDTADLFDYDEVRNKIQDHLHSHVKAFQLKDLTFSNGDLVEVLYTPFNMNGDSINQTFNLEKEPDSLEPIVSLMKMLSILPSELRLSPSLFDGSSVDLNVIDAIQELTFSTDFSTATVTPDTFFELVSAFAYNYQIPAYMMYLSVRDLLRRDHDKPLIVDSDNIVLVSHDGGSGSSDIYDTIFSEPLEFDFVRYNVEVPGVNLRYSVDEVCGLSVRAFRVSEVNTYPLKQLSRDALNADRDTSPSELPATRYELYKRCGAIREYIEHIPGRVTLKATYTSMLDNMIHNHAEVELQPMSMKL